eukprot:m.100594 g.100594  ORF g.100594 m.100594 type:complete len:159 (+) comp20686_c2_seq1:229-705(+)
MSRYGSTLGVAALLLVCQLGHGASDDCSVVSVSRDGTRTSRGCAEVDVHDALRGFSTKKVDGKTEEVPTVHPNFEFMKGSRWLWNNWREVEFTTDGSFVAPAENCDVKGNAACKWSATDEAVIVHFGGAGAHTLTVEGNSMSGSRDSDGEGVSAVRVA